MSTTQVNDKLKQAIEPFLVDFINEYSWLGKLADKYGIELAALQGLLKFLKKAPNLRKESSPINIGLVWNNEKVALPNPAISSTPFLISETGKFGNLKDIVNGRTLCYLIDEKAMVTIKGVPKELVGHTAQESLQLISSQFRTVCVYSQGADTYIFASGDIAQIRRNGIWLDPCKIAFTEMTREGFPEQLLLRVLHVCCQLSEKEIGGTFVISHENPVPYCVPMNKECEFEKKSLSDIQDAELIDFANIDGAIILDIKGEVQKIGQKLDAPDVGLYEVGSGRGTRHNSASKYSKASKSAVFVVSEDGPISLYFNGKLIGHCFENLFG